jgi:hypothetical protein
LLFGGFDLTPLLDKSRSKFEQIMEQATDRGMTAELDDSAQEFSAEQFRTIRTNLEDYLSNSRR